ncbi:MAG: HEPN domain-containing protein [Candidatus Nanopelagicales bacterium]
MTWAQGQATIRAMLTDGQLQQVPASRTHADVLLAQAHAHLAAAQAIQDADPTGAYALLYDAARKALVAVLENQGLRPTRRGGHIAAYEAVRAELDPPLGAHLRPYDRMRRRRNESEYPSADVPEVTTDEISDDLPKVRTILDIAAPVLDQMSPWR